MRTRIEVPALRRIVAQPVPVLAKLLLLAIRVRVQLIGHARNNMQVNLSRAWLSVAD